MTDSVFPNTCDCLDNDDQVEDDLITSYQLTSLDLCSDLGLRNVFLSQNKTVLTKKYLC